MWYRLTSILLFPFHSILISVITINEFTICRLWLGYLNCMETILINSGMMGEAEVLEAGMQALPLEGRRVVEKPIVMGSVPYMSQREEKGVNRGGDLSPAAEGHGER